MSNPIPDALSRAQLDLLDAEAIDQMLRRLDHPDVTVTHAEAENVIKAAFKRLAAAREFAAHESNSAKWFSDTGARAFKMLREVQNDVHAFVRQVQADGKKLGSPAAGKAFCRLITVADEVDEREAITKQVEQEAARQAAGQ